MAAVTAPGRLPTGDAVASYALVTRDAVGGAADVHDRMPLVLPRDFHDEWLAPDRAGDAELVATALRLSEEISREFSAGADGATGVRRAPAPEAPPTLF